jgi:hypothetical protein
MLTVLHRSLKIVGIFFVTKNPRFHNFYKYDILMSASAASSEFLIGGVTYILIKKNEKI